MLTYLLRNFGLVIVALAIILLDVRLERIENHLNAVTASQLEANKVVTMYAAKLPISKGY